MDPTTRDSRLVVAMAGVLVAWLCCQAMLWVNLFGRSGSLPAAAGVALGLALWLTAGLPAWLVRQVHRLQALRRPEALVHEAADDRVSSSGKADVKSAMRLMAISGGIAAVGAGLAMAAVFPGAGFLEGLSRKAGLGPAGWLTVHVLTATVGFLPATAGLTLLFLSSSVIRSGTSRDAYANCAREWCAGVACGTGLFGLLVLVGADLLAVGPLLAMAILALSALWWMRKDLEKRPGRLIRPVRNPSPGARLRTSMVPGAIVLGLGLQLRLLRDVAGATLGIEALWICLTLLLVVRFQRDTDAKGRMPGRRQGAGCVIGVASVLLGQLALSGLALVSDAHQIVCLTLAVGMQAPLAAMTGILVSRGRLRFVDDAGRPRQYLAQVGLGLALGYLAHHLIWSSGMALGLTGLFWLAVAAGALAQVLRNCKRSVDLVRWLLAGGILLLLPVAELWLAALRLQSRYAGIYVGRCLTCVQDRLNPAKRSPLPFASFWQSGKITRLTLAAMGGPQSAGRWWIVSQSPEQLIPVQPDSQQVMAGALDPLALAAGAWKRHLMGGPRRSWIRGAASGRTWMDAAAVDAIRADHPQAWRYLNLGVLTAVARQLQGHPGGARPLVLRSRIVTGSAGRIVAVAQTFRQAVGSGYLAVEFFEQQADFVLAGPKDAVAVPENLSGVFVVDLETLAGKGPGVEPIRTIAPAGIFAASCDVETFVVWLRKHALP